MLFPVISSAAQYSKLWGRDGELWKPVEGDHTKLLDFTDVGYMNGDVPLPEWPVSVNVRDYGAKGDGETDDTEAFVRAIAAAEPESAIFVPVGRYKIMQQIDLNKDQIVLRGEDMYRTVLWCPKVLDEVNPYIVANQSPKVQAASYDAEGKSYDGRMIGELGPPHDKDGNPVQLKIKNHWPPRDHPNKGGYLYKKNGSQVGIENLTIELKEEPKGWHWEHIGANGIMYEGVEDSWIRNVQIKNADHGITLRSCQNISVINILFDAYTLRAAGSSPVDGHAAIRFGDTKRSLLHNAILTGPYIHGVMINGSSDDNVYSRISGHVKLDHHSIGGVRSLFTEIHFSKGYPAFAWSQWETYWGMRSRVPISYDDVRGAREHKRNVIVGMHTEEPSSSGKDYWHESLDPEQLHPPNLYIAQMKKKGKPLPEYTFPEKPIPPEGPRDFMPDADSTVLPGSEENFGEDWKLALRDGQVAYLKFDLSESEIKQAEKAILHLFDGDPPKTNRPFWGRMEHPDPKGKKAQGKREPTTPAKAFAVSDDSWKEHLINGVNAPKAGEVVAEFMLGSFDWNSVDITDYVNQQLAGDKIVSLKISAEGKARRMRSSNSGKAPYLTIIPK